MVNLRFWASAKPVEIVEGRRSARDAQDWVCSCGTWNPPTRKTVFAIPKFSCDGCGKKYLDNHDLIFSLADVEINGEPLLRRIFLQIGGTCIPNAMCQVLQINYALECILRDKKMNPEMFRLDPQVMIDAYYKRYPLMRAGSNGSIKPCSVHMAMKMMHWLKTQGFPLEDGSTYKIGDYSYIPCAEYEALCEELADGVPLMTTFVPGRSFGKVQYCQLYKPPMFSDVKLCNAKHLEHNRQSDEKAQQSLHVQHMVVLLGPATSCANGEKGFIFVNSHGIWWPKSCEGAIISERPGIGKVVEDGLLYNAVKFWLPGETAVNSPHQFVDEEEGYMPKYYVDQRNRDRLLGRTN